MRIYNGSFTTVKWRFTSLYLPSPKQSFQLQLKMLGLYLYTFIISHKIGKMLSILNKLTLQKDLQMFVTNSVFMDKK